MTGNHGGARKGAGRPKGINTPLSPSTIERMRNRIQAEAIIQRLNDFVLGNVEMPAPAVTAAIGLLRKVMPDLSQAENKTEVTHRYVARVPEKAPTAEAWQQQHAPQTQH